MIWLCFHSGSDSRQLSVKAPKDYCMLKSTEIYWYSLSFMQIPHIFNAAMFDVKLTLNDTTLQAYSWKDFTQYRLSACNILAYNLMCTNHTHLLQWSLVLVCTGYHQSTSLSVWSVMPWFLLFWNCDPSFRGKSQVTGSHHDVFCGSEGALLNNSWWNHQNQ